MERTYHFMDGISRLCRNLTMYKNISFAVLLFILACSPRIKKTGLADAVQDTVRVLTYNMWLGGQAGSQPLDKSIEVIRISGAGIVGLQETYPYHADGSVLSDNASLIAGNLRWNYFSQNGSGIITAYEITDTTENKLGIKLKIGNDRYLWFFNCHLFHMPYQPYQLAGKPYGDFPFISTEQEAITFAKSARGAEVNKYVEEIRSILPEGWPVILTGDFNEPSFQDWTTAAVKDGLCQLKVEWPSTKAFADLGMTDAFRVMYPDEVSVRGETWSSIDTPGEIHDRIDFIFYRNEQLKVISAQTIGFKDGKSDIGIPDYPSDHRAVCINFVWIKN
ncbi:MAG: endonuclease/exonuclease/phosphatase family protein [Mangrovibacterium sp.]